MSRGHWLEEKKKKKDDDDSDEDKEKKDSPANRMRRDAKSNDIRLLHRAQLSKHYDFLKSVIRCHDLW